MATYGIAAHTLHTNDNLDIYAFPSANAKKWDINCARITRSNNDDILGIKRIAPFSLNINSSKVKIQKCRLTRGKMYIQIKYGSRTGWIKAATSSAGKLFSNSTYAG